MRYLIEIKTPGEFKILHKFYGDGPLSSLNLNDLPLGVVILSSNGIRANSSEICESAPIENKHELKFDRLIPFKMWHDAFIGNNPNALPVEIDGDMFTPSEVEYEEDLPYKYSLIVQRPTQDLEDSYRGPRVYQTVTGRSVNELYELSSIPNYILECLRAVESEGHFRAEILVNDTIYKMYIKP
jgi:hypothetical protein